MNRFFTICFLLLALAVQAQSQVAGKWYGAGKVAGINNSNTYLCEFILLQKGNTVTGSFNYYFRNGYFSNSISGTYNNTSRQLKLKFIPIILHKTVNAAIGVDCSMRGEFTLKTSKTESTLTGAFMANDQYAYTCKPIQIKFVKQIKEVPFEIIKDSLEVDTTELPTLPLQLPPAVDTTLQKQVNAVASKRVNNAAKQLPVQDDSVTIDLYDNGTFDSDSVSVLYNGELKVYKKELNTRTAITVKLAISKSAPNQLVLIAENLGTIPPNSALMVVRDSRYRHEVNLTSSLERNAVVELVYTPKKTGK